MAPGLGFIIGPVLGAAFSPLKPGLQVACESSSPQPSVNSSLDLSFGMYGDSGTNGTIVEKCAFEFNFMTGPGYLSAVLGLLNVVFLTLYFQNLRVRFLQGTTCNCVLIRLSSR
jgi:hypothetical protein